MFFISIHFSPTCLHLRRLTGYLSMAYQVTGKKWYLATHRVRRLHDHSGSESQWTFIVHQSSHGAGISLTTSPAVPSTRDSHLPTCPPRPTSQAQSVALWCPWVLGAPLGISPTEAQAADGKCLSTNFC